MAVGPYGALLEAVRGVRWPARRPVAGGSPGAHPARTRGVAPEFAEYRPYRQGDDPRRLDWKLLGRSDRAFIRLAPDRAVIATLLAIDASASMAFAGKWAMARHLAVACAAVGHGVGDPVGLAVAAGGGISRLAPRTRRDVVAEIARTLDAITPAGSVSLAAAFLGAPSRVLVVTDCLGDLDGLRRAARVHATAGGEVHVVHVVARAELQPPRGAMLATDPEDAAIARTLTDATRAAYRMAFDSWRDDVARSWRDMGVSYHEAVDDEAPDVVVRRVVTTPRAGRSRT
jgi:uncharacterized protein (DUF58 family)